MDYTIKQMAEMFDVTEHTLRFYTDEGLLPCERDGATAGCSMPNPSTGCRAAVRPLRIFGRIAAFV